MQQVTTQAVAALPQWKVKVQKCKAVQTVLNLCSPSVTDKCLIAEAWCPTAKLPELQSALREGGVRLRETAVMAYTDHYYIKSFFLFLYYLFFSPEEEWQWCGLFLQSPALLHPSTHIISAQLLHNWVSEHSGCLWSGKLS